MASRAPGGQHRHDFRVRAASRSGPARGNTSLWAFYQVSTRMSQIVNLRQMQVGQQGKIAAVEALGEMNRRIRDMGLIPGTTVSIVGRAPLKDPVALRLSGVTISLRNSEADYIKVDLSGAAG